MQTKQPQNQTNSYNLNTDIQMDDWISWLSQTPLHPSLVYNYSILFARNELTLNDVAYFDHNFLLSMGITVAKHRLEILKLARPKTHRDNPRNPLHSFLKSLANTTRCGLLRCAKKLVLTTHHRRYRTESEPERLGRSLSPLNVEWKEIKKETCERYGQLDYEGSRSLRSPTVMADPSLKSIAKSGALVLKKQMGLVEGSSSLKRYMSGPINGGKSIKARSHSFSGPLDGRQSFSKSLKLNGHLDGYYKPEAHSPWALLFDDLKPT